jgi:flagellar hook-associated protein 1 FlgK
MSSFSGLNVGLSSLYAQRRGLELAGHNIANANTEGYSRQRMRLESDGGPLTPAMHAQWNGAGNGVDVVGTSRLRDVFLESRGLQERGTESGLRTSQTLLSRVESILGEPGEAGLQAQLAEFWAGWDDVAKNATDLAARNQLLERASTLATGLNSSAARLESQWEGSREQLVGTVQELNATAANVAELNRAIVSASNAGLSPHDLADQRDVLVQRLGEMAGVTSRIGEAGTVDVYLGGTALVRGASSEALTVQVAAAPAKSVSLAWASDGKPVAAVGGQVGALAQGLNVTLPRYLAKLDGVAASLVETVNTAHRSGWDQDGVAGGDFFGGTSASSIAVTVPGGRQIAASGAPGQVHNGSNAATLAEMALADGGPDELYRGLIVELGVEAQTANRRVDIQSEITRQVDAARDSEAGVNLDEEMTSMLAYQRGYEGAARFVTAVDQMLDTLINRTGLVGR